MGGRDPDDSRRVTRAKKPGVQQRSAPVRQHNNAQEVTGGGLPDPKRAHAFDQDEG